MPSIWITCDVCGQPLARNTAYTRTYVVGIGKTIVQTTHKPSEYCKPQTR